MDYVFLAVIIFFALGLIFMLEGFATEFPTNTVFFFLSFLSWFEEGLLFLIGMSGMGSPYDMLAAATYLFFFFLSIVNFVLFTFSALEVYRQRNKEKEEAEDVKRYGTPPQKTGTVRRAWR